MSARSVVLTLFFIFIVYGTICHLTPYELRQTIAVHLVILKLTHRFLSVVFLLLSRALMASE